MLVTSILKTLPKPKFKTTVISQDCIDAHYIINVIWSIASKTLELLFSFTTQKNYDAHLIRSNLDKLNTEKENVNVIAQNSENMLPSH